MESPSGPKHETNGSLLDAGFGRPFLLGPIEFAVSLGALALLAALVVMALLLDSNRPKAMRVGFSAATYLSGLVVWGMSRRRGRTGPGQVPATPFVISGCGAGLVSGLLQSDLNITVVVVQVAGAGLLLGGFHWLAVRVWRRVHGWVVA